MTNKNNTKSFDEEFKGAFQWVYLNCKGEIISGVDMENLSGEIKSHIHNVLDSLKQTGKNHFGEGHNSNHNHCPCSAKMQEKINNSIEEAKKKV